MGCGASATLMTGLYVKPTIGGTETYSVIGRVIIWVQVYYAPFLAM
jgi:hypothetical protein